MLAYRMSEGDGTGICTAVKMSCLSTSEVVSGAASRWRAPDRDRYPGLLDCVLYAGDDTYDTCGLGTEDRLRYPSPCYGAWRL